MSIKNRYDFIYLFDVTDGNPNGDPDAGNLPRVDPQTFQGLVTDGCLKRKVRDYVIAAKGDGNGSHEPGFAVYFQTKGGPEQRVLNTIHESAYKAIGKKPKDKKYEDQVAARQWMCGNFFDVRTFGAVMSTEINCGQVRGPVQFTFARSLDNIVQQEFSISRKAVTTEKEAKKQVEKHGDITGTLGRKAQVPYGLYRMHGFISANEAATTGFAEADLALLWKALCGRSSESEPQEESMFGQDHSASRGLMVPRALIAFEHQSKLGNAPAHRLFESMEVTLRDGCANPRNIKDYQFSFNREHIPETIKVLRLLEPEWN